MNNNTNFNKNNTDSIELQEGLWLVKVPNLVYNSVKDLPPNTSFGKLEIIQNEIKESAFKPKINSSLKSTAPINSAFYNKSKNNNISNNDILLNKKRTKISSIIMCNNNNHELIDKNHEKSQYLKFDINTNLLHLNKSKRKDYREYYDEQTKKI